MCEFNCISPWYGSIQKSVSVDYIMRFGLNAQFSITKFSFFSFGAIMFG
jgi:hypothetical protein